MLKGCVFRARRKAACESVSLILQDDYSKCLVGRLKSATTELSCCSKDNGGPADDRS